VLLKLAPYSGVQNCSTYCEIVGVGDSENMRMLAESRTNGALLSHFLGITAWSTFCSFSESSLTGN